MDPVVQQGADRPGHRGRDGQSGGEGLGLGSVLPRVAAGPGLSVREAEELHRDQGDEGATDEGGDGLLKKSGFVLEEKKEREGMSFVFRFFFTLDLFLFSLSFQKLFKKKKKKLTISNDRSKAYTSVLDLAGTISAKIGLLHAGAGQALTKPPRMKTAR